MGNTTSNDKSSNKSNAEFISDTNTKLKDAGISHNILNDITQSINNRFTCDDECQKERKTSALKDKLNDDKRLYNELPDKIQEDEKQYYLEAKGEDYYKDDILKVRYGEVFQSFKNNKVKQLDEVKDDIEKDLENYRSDKIAEARMEQLYKESLKTNKALKKDIDNYYKKVFTDERKVYYKDQQLDNLEYYQKLILYVYYAVLVLYIVAGSFIWQKKYMSILVWVLMLLYITFPLLLKYLTQFIAEFIGESKADKRIRKNEYYVIEKGKKKKEENVEE